MNDLPRSVAAFMGKSDLVTIMGWNVEHEPPLLVSTQALLRTANIIGSVYPDGFIIIDDESQSALLVDIDDEEGIHTERIELPV